MQRRPQDSWQVSLRFGGLSLMTENMFQIQMQYIVAFAPSLGIPEKSIYADDADDAIANLCNAY